MIMKFEDHKRAQAYIVTDNEGMVLISYTTPVISITDGWLHVNGLYSMTTRKHIGWFMRKLGFDYQLAKQLYSDHADMNIYTGEIRFA